MSGEPTNRIAFPRLALEIKCRARTQSEIARKVPMTAYRISHIIRGHARPAAWERQRLSELLGIDEAELFTALSGNDNQ